MRTHTINVPVSYRRITSRVLVSCRRGYGQRQRCVKGTNMVNVPVCVLWTREERGHLMVLDANTADLLTSYVQRINGVDAASAPVY